MKLTPTVLPPTARVPISALLAANAISQTGNVLTSIAVPWFVLETTGSAARTGITAAVTVIPTIVAGIFGGALVDRLGFKRTSVVSDVASGVTVAMIPLIHFATGIAFWQLLTLMFLSALLDVPGSTARQSLIPDLARQAGMPLERANAAVASIGRAAQLAAPLLAGLLIASIGAVSVLWINAATFALSAVMVAIAIPATRSSPTEGGTGRYLSDLVEGFRFLSANRLLLSLLVTAASLNFIFNPLAAVVLPVYADERYGSAANLGLLIGGNALGMLAGTIFYGAVGHRLSRRWVYVVAFSFVPLPLLVLAATPGIVPSVVALVVLGLLFGPTGPIFATVLQERVPERMRGRIFGLVGASVWLILPLGMLVAGFLLEGLGVRMTLLIDAGATAVVAVGVTMNRTLRSMDTPGADG